LAYGSACSGHTQHLLGQLVSDTPRVDAFVAEMRRPLGASYQGVTAALREEGIPYLPAKGGLFVVIDPRGFLSEPNRRRRSGLAVTRVSLVVLVLVSAMVVAFFVHARAWVFLCDHHAFISFRYARNLAELGALPEAPRCSGASVNGSPQRKQAAVAERRLPASCFRHRGHRL
jgi:hypothetical protein